eukprot:scaffold116384_cov53-Attheya_sp.AAC.4
MAFSCEATGILLSQVMPTKEKKKKWREERSVSNGLSTDALSLCCSKRRVRAGWSKITHHEP